MPKTKTCTKSKYNNELHARKRLKAARKRRFLRGEHPDTWEKAVYLCSKCSYYHLTGIRENDWLTRTTKK